MALDAIIFDIDGTLVDTNAIHIEAYRQAFASREYKIESDRIAIEVGKGGDTLVPDIIGKSADKRDGEAIRQTQPEAFRKIAEREGIRVFSGAVELIAAVRQRGLKAILATSSNSDQLATIEQFSNVRWRELVDDVVDADDIERSKPFPDLISASVMKLGRDASPGLCAMIGDTPYDAQSARHAGVVTIGVLSGGNSTEILMRAGARGVYRDVGEILEKLPGVLKHASPGSARLDRAKLEALMRRALDVAEQAMRAGEAPIGCVLMRGDGETIVASAFNELNRTQNRAAHAEMVAFANAAGKLPEDANDLILISTLEPCVMCTGAAMECGVDTIVFALRAPADGGTSHIEPPLSPESQMPKMIGDILARESRAMFERWLKEGNVNPKQRAYVEQLLRT